MTTDRPTDASPEGEPKPPLFLVQGDATPEEVAALTVVLQGLAASAAPADRGARPEWAAPHRLVRPALRSGPGGWRSSSMPR